MTRDELRQTNTGKQVATFTLAVDRGRREPTARAWRTGFPSLHGSALPSLPTKWLTKGQMVAVDGRLQSRTYTAKDGTNRTVLEVVANNINFCGSKRTTQGLFQLPLRGPEWARPHRSTAAGRVTTSP